MEQVLNNPLSGEEVKDIIVAKIRRALDLDGTIVNFAAYSAFSFHVDMTILLPGAVSQENAKTVSGSIGTMTDQQAQEASVVPITVDQPEMPPNEARMDAELPLHVATTDEQGRPIEKKVKYGQQPARSAPKR